MGEEGDKTMNKTKYKQISCYKETRETTLFDKSDLPVQPQKEKREDEGRGK